MTRLIHWGWILIAALSLGWFGWHAHHLLLKFPPIWPDEALFADPAIHLIRHGTMGTKLLAGLLPGIERHTYWMPPGYFLFLSLVFWFAQPGLIPLRLSSLAASLGVMVLVYLLGRRSGLGRYLALFPVALLGIDQLYLRGSLVGRMDLLCLFFILLTLILLTGDSAKSHTKILTGIGASLALLIHPMGIVAPITTLLAWWQRHRSPRTLLWTCVGLALPLLLWILYIFQAPGDFWAQFGSQFMRKQGRPHLPFSIQGFLAKLHDYEIDREWIILWFLGLCGLLLSVGRSYGNLGLALCQLMLLGLVLWGQEMWYFTYLAPLTFIGLAHWVTFDKKRLVTQLLWMVPMMFLFYHTAHFVKRNVQRTAAFHQEQVRLFREGTDYLVWAQKISDLLPVGSRVFVVSIPDPTFVLWSRPDLVLHNFVPGDVPVQEDAYRQVMESSDYFVVSQPPPNEREAKFAEEHGELVATIGSPLKPAYVARIYKM